MKSKKSYTGIYLKDVLKKHRKKIFQLKYGARLFKTFLLAQLDVFYGMHDHHMPIAFKKSSFSELWNAEYDLIDQTCRNKFRSKNDVSIWLVRYFQLLEGKFTPRSNKFGKFFEIQDFLNAKNIKKTIDGKYKIICVNDSEYVNAEFETEKMRFCEIMNTILPEKSSFEA